MSTCNTHLLEKWTKVSLLQQAGVGGCAACALISKGLSKLLKSDPPPDFEVERIRYLGASLWVNLLSEAEEVAEFVLDSTQTGISNDMIEQCGILPGASIPPLAEHNIGLVKEWIAHCEASHKECVLSEPILPKRVLNIGSQVDSAIRLFESEHVIAEYIALSHRWGVSGLITTTRGNLKEHQAGIAWDALPKSFQDAIQVARILNVQYLWIDSLCIIQDDQQDWETESTKMSSIYASAHLTIAANTSNGLLLGPQAARTLGQHVVIVEIPDTEPLKIHVRWRRDHNKFYAGSLETYIAEAQLDYPLSKRGWCFQERLLARRVLHFTDDEMVFECKNDVQCECGGATLKGRSANPLKSYYRQVLNKVYYGHFADNAWEAWTTVVTPFIRMSLTYRTDALPAVAGIASRFDGQELGNYVAGLWSNYLDIGLFWIAEINRPREKPEWTGPSFSWVSLAGTCVVDNLYWYLLTPDHREQLQKHFEITDIMINVAGLNPLGSVESASLHIHGYLVEAEIRASFNGIRNSIIVTINGRETKTRAFFEQVRIEKLVPDRPFFMFIGFSFYENDRHRNPPTDGTFATILVLLPVGNNRYERIGIIPQFSFDLDDLASRETLDFELV